MFFTYCYCCREYFIYVMFLFCVQYICRYTVRVKYTHIQVLLYLRVSCGSGGRAVQTNKHNQALLLHFTEAENAPHCLWSMAHSNTLFYRIFCFHYTNYSHNIVDFNSVFVLMLWIIVYTALLAAFYCSVFCFYFYKQISYLLYLTELVIE